LALAIHSGDLAVLGEFSGIREYILRPLPGAGAACRVRARSFRVRAFAHLIKREIRRRCGESKAPALDGAGELAEGSISKDGFLLVGRADEGAERALSAYQAELDRWSLAELGGELVFHLAAARCGDAIPHDDLQAKLAHRLLRPLEGALVSGARWNNAAFRSGWGDPHAKVCAGCGATVGDVSAGSLCDSCIDDDELGRLLPSCNFGHRVEPEHATVHVPGQGLALSTADVSMAGSGDLDLTTADWALLRRLPHGDFDALAQRSPGRRKLLAYLAIAVEAYAAPEIPTAEPTVAAVAEPSAETSVETSVETPAEITAETTVEPEPPAETTAETTVEPIAAPAPAATPPPSSVAEHAYHVMIARYPDVFPIQGDGDTLLAAGPWDQVLRLALELRHDFRDTARNPGERLAFRAGLVLEHPAARLRSAVDHAYAELARAHDGGSEVSGCISLFGEILPWPAAKDVADRGFEMASWLKEDRMSSSALRRIGELHRVSQGGSRPGANHWKFRYVPLLIWQARDADRLLRRKILRLAADSELWQNTGLVTELAFLAAPLKGDPVPSSASALGTPVKAGGELDG
jgi:hypothetical protein